MNHNLNEEVELDRLQFKYSLNTFLRLLFF